FKVDYRWAKRRLDMRFTQDNGTAVADASGIATFRVPTIYTLYVYGDKKLRPTHEVSVYDEGGSTLHILHSRNGESDRNTYSARVPKGLELTVSIVFDPPTDR